MNNNKENNATSEEAKAKTKEKSGKRSVGVDDTMGGVCWLDGHTLPFGPVPIYVQYLNVCLPLLSTTSHYDYRCRFYPSSFSLFFIFQLSVSTIYDEIPTESSVYFLSSLVDFDSVILSLFVCLCVSQKEIQNAEEFRNQLDLVVSLYCCLFYPFLFSFG